MYKSNLIVICTFAIYNLVNCDLRFAESLSENILKKYPAFNIDNDTYNNVTSVEIKLDEIMNIIYTKNKLSHISTSTQNCSLEDKICQRIFSTECHRAKDLLELRPDGSSLSLPAVLADLSPLLFFQSGDGGCLTEGGDPARADGHHTKPTRLEVWGYGLIFVTIINLCSLIGVVVIPLLSSKVYQTVILVFEGLAVGSLVGTALFHLIPQSFDLLEQDASHTYLWKALVIFLGIYLFFVGERVMKICFQSQNDLNTSTIEESVTTPESGHSLLPNGLIGDKTPNGKLANSIGCLATLSEGDEGLNEVGNHHQFHHGHSHNLKVVSQKEGPIRSVAWMILLGDAFHNFIDGMSIGAAFSESIMAGVSVSVAVLAEELPHELGDFAVLLAAGMSFRRALGYNFLSACTCYIGLMIGIGLGDLAQGSQFVLAFAGGMFLYISLVGMMAEIIEALEISQKKDPSSQTLYIFLLQNIGILFGVVALFLFARYNELINFDSS